MSEAELPPGWPAMSIAQAHALLGQPGAVTEVVEEVVRGVTLKVWKNQPPTLRSVVEAGRLHGEKIFLVYEDERVSFEAFHRAVAAFAIELQAQGVVKGDRVAVIMRNLPEWPVAFFAGVLAGASMAYQLSITSMNVIPYSRKTGTVGMMLEREPPVTASMFRRPDLTCGSIE